MLLNFWQCARKSLLPIPPTNKELLSNPNVSGAEVRNSSFPPLFFWSCSQVHEAYRWSLPLLLYSLWQDWCLYRGRHLHILTLVTEHSWKSYSEKSPPLQALLNTKMATLAKGAISTPLSISRWLVPSRHPCKESEKCVLTTTVLCMWTPWPIGSCVCARDSEINFWPSFTAQIFKKLVVKNSFCSHFSKCKSSNWVQGARETIIFINIFLIVALLKPETPAASPAPFVTMGVRRHWVRTEGNRELSANALCVYFATISH